MEEPIGWLFLNLLDASGAPCLGTATNIRDGSLSAADAAIAK
jgi:hypothetical protein